MLQFSHAASGGSLKLGPPDKQLLGTAAIERAGEALQRASVERPDSLVGRVADRFALPLQTPALETAWLCFPLMIRPDAGFERAQLQEFIDARGVDTRTVWTGNAVRQPMMRGASFHQPRSGLPHADAVMERGVVLPMSHALGDDDIGFVIEQVSAFLDAL